MKLDRSNMKKIIFILCSSILFCILLIRFDTVIGIIGEIISLLTPVIIGLCLAFILSPVMTFVEDVALGWLKVKMPKRGAKIARVCGMVFAYMLLGGLLVLLGAVIVPDVEEAVLLIADSLPGMVDQLKVDMVGIMEMLGLENVPEIESSTNWKEVSKELIELIRNSDYSNILNGILNTATSVIGVLFDLVVGIVTSVYVMAQKEQIAAFLKRTLRAYSKERTYKRVMRVATLTNSCFRSFVSGQLIEALILGTLCFIGMLIFRFPYALATSALICFTALIPVFGAWIGGALGAVLALTVSPMKALAFIIYIVVLQQIEGNLIYPKVVGKSVGLPGVLVLLAVVIGGNVSGVFGMLIAVPLCSIFYVLLRQSVDGRLKNKEAKKKALAAETGSVTVDIQPQEPIKAPEAAKAPSKPTVQKNQNKKNSGKKRK